LLVWCRSFEPPREPIVASEEHAPKPGKAAEPRLERSVPALPFLLIGSLLWGELLPREARAADPDEPYDAAEILIEDAAEKPPRVYEDTPIQTEVIPRADVERRPGTSAADLLRTLPGVRQQQRVQGEEAAVSIEGMPPEYTRALVDGERYAGEIGAVDDFRRIPLHDADRVEVLRGAQALRYGSEAAGGVVRIDTPDPPADGVRLRSEGGYGGGDWIYGAGSAGYGNERAGAWLRFVHDQIRGYDGPDDPGDAVLVSPGHEAERVSQDVYGKLRFDPTTSLRSITRIGWREDDETGLSGESGEGTRNERRWLFGQETKLAIGERTRIDASFSWYDVALESEAGRAWRLDEDEASGRFAIEHDFETGPVRHGLTIGFDALAPRLDLAESAFESEVENSLFDATAVEESLQTGGAFVILASEYGDWLALEGGVRLQLHSEYEPELLPQVAVLVTPWRPDASRFVRFRVGYGLGYRTPSLRDLYQPPVAQLGGLYFLAGNPDLVPEHVATLRAGFEASPFERVAISVTAFHNDIEDHIRSSLAGSIQVATAVVPPRPLTPSEEALCSIDPALLPECSRTPTRVPQNSALYRKTNLDAVITRGVEARMRLRPHRLVDLEAAYTYLDTEVEDSNSTLTELPNEPHHVVDLLLGLEAPRTATRLAVLARWRGAALTETSGTGLLSFGSFEESTPSWQIDLRLVQPVRPGFELYADLFNATDERVVDSYAVRGRTAFVGLRLAFD
jgi:outer membrane receptor protein involved in Fe transport